MLSKCRQTDACCYTNCEHIYLLLTHSLHLPSVPSLWASSQMTAFCSWRHAVPHTGLHSVPHTELHTVPHACSSAHLPDCATVPLQLCLSGSSACCSHSIPPSTPSSRPSPAPSLALQSPACFSTGTTAPQSAVPTALFSPPSKPQTHTHGQTLHTCTKHTYRHPAVQEIAGKS